MGQTGLAAAQKKAWRLRAHLVFIDESGFLMAPLVRTSWAPRGRTPTLQQRTRSRQKVSAIAALCVSPTRHRIDLYFRLKPNANFDTAAVTDFLGHLLRHRPGPVLVLWDRWMPHRAKKMTAFVSHRPRLHPHFLPAYAPELNPVEYLWSWLKANPLANFAPHDVEPLARAARRSARAVQKKQRLLRSFIRHSPLSLCLK